MRESDFKKWEQPFPLQQESWIEIDGFIGIEHATQGAYLFNHELGQCWIPKRAVKFERKIAMVAGEAEYKILVASWFNWTEKIKMMREGKLVSDEVLNARKEAEVFFKIDADVEYIGSERKSVMPKKKTLKRVKNRKVDDDTWSEIFGSFTSPDPFPKAKRESEPNQPYSLTEEMNKTETDKLKLELKTLREDLKFYLVNNSKELYDPTRKKILALILKKEEFGMEKTNADNRFIQKLKVTGFYSLWKKQIENGEKEETKPEPKNRAIDL